MIFWAENPNRPEPTSEPPNSVEIPSPTIGPQMVFSPNKVRRALLRNYRQGTDMEPSRTYQHWARQIGHQSKPFLGTPEPRSTPIGCKPAHA